MRGATGMEVIRMETQVGTSCLHPHGFGSLLSGRNA